MVAAVQAIVLVDCDKRLQSISSSICPSALLPVANKEMILYILDMLENSGIKNVILVRLGPSCLLLSSKSRKGTRVSLCFPSRSLVVFPLRWIKKGLFDDVLFARTM